MTLNPNRLQSIDVFRAITMLLMVFVNDVASVRHIPEWIDHVTAEADGMGFADTIFPAFLFIVGLSLPFAIENRRKKGHLPGNIVIYIVSRSLALIVMGFFHVNSEYYNNSAALLPRSVWIILITISFFLIWFDYPANLPRQKKYTYTGVGIALLLLCALIYKGGTAEHPIGLQPHWWGILGLIGWAYLICALIYFFAKGEALLLSIALVILIIINLATHAGWWHHPHLFIIGDASCASLVMAGTIAAMAYRKYAPVTFSNTALLFILTGILLIAAGFCVRPYAAGISKIRATPAWIFICAGISLLVFILIAWLVDVKGKYQWFASIKPAGTSTLTCYLLPYILYSLFVLVHFRYPAFLSEGFGGICRSFIIAFLMVQATGWLERNHIRLKV